MRRAFILAAALAAIPLGAEADENSRLEVLISPPQAQAEGAWWRINDGPNGLVTSWRRHGEWIRGIANGPHRLEFKDSRGENPAATCAAPAAHTVFIRPGAPHFPEGVFVCGELRAAQARASSRSMAAEAATSLTVRIEPQDAIDQGAQWSLDDGGWQASGAKLHDVSDGDHLVRFKAASGDCTAAPPDEVYTFRKGDQIALIRRYGGLGCSDGARR